VACKPVGGKGESYPDTFPDTFSASDRPAPFAISRRTAITAQQFCSIAVVEDLIGRDGINKTTV
jgi:hypothetical protein